MTHDGSIVQKCQFCGSIGCGTYKVDPRKLAPDAPPYMRTPLCISIQRGNSYRTIAMHFNGHAVHPESCPVSYNPHLGKCNCMHKDMIALLEKTDESAAALSRMPLLTNHESATYAAQRLNEKRIARAVKKALGDPRSLLQPRWFVNTRLRPNDIQSSQKTRPGTPNWNGL